MAHYTQKHRLMCEICYIIIENFLQNAWNNGKNSCSCPKITVKPLKNQRYE